MDPVNVTQYAAMIGAALLASHKIDCRYLIPSTLEIAITRNWEAGKPIDIAAREISRTVKLQRDFP